MALIIKDDILEKVQMSGKELLIDLACYLYDKKRMSMGQARHLADLDHIGFQKELAKRDIDIHYDEKDLRKDLDNLDINI
jgi:predicted HTH domain antitoxin